MADKDWTYAKPMYLASPWLDRFVKGWPLVLALVGCREGEARRETYREPAPLLSVVSPVASLPQPLPPASLPQPPPPSSLGGTDRGFELVTLPLTQYGPATIAVPRGATEPRPLVVALHAHTIRPEHACERWYSAAGSYAYVLCPFGLPRDARPNAPVTLGDVGYTEREIEAGLQALRSRYGGAVVTESPMLVGWSHGAKIGALLLARAPFAYGHVALGEGGYEQLTDATLNSWGKRPQRRVLFLCSTKPCEITYGAVRRRCERAGLDCRVEGTGGHKHPFDGDAVEMATRVLPWLLTGNPTRATVRGLP